MKIFFKHLSLQIIILLSIGVGFAAWNTLVSDGDTVTAIKWNDLVNQISSVTNNTTNLSASGGNIGIGVTNPSRLLTLKNDSNSPIIRLDRGTPYSYELYSKAGGGFHIAGRGNGTGGGYDGSSDLMDLFYIHYGGGITQNSYSVLGGTYTINSLETGVTNTDWTIRVLGENGSNSGIPGYPSGITTGGMFFVKGPALGDHYLSIIDNGNVGIGTTVPTHKIDVVGTAGLSTGTAWTNTSDKRLKDIHGDYEYGLDEILRLRTIRFNYKENNPLGLPSDIGMIGFVAQEVQEIIPEAVSTREDGYLELNVDPIHWSAINAIQELWGIITGNTQRIQELEKKMEMLEAKINS